MGPELDVLMPLYFLAAAAPFEVQLGVVEFDIRPEQIFGYVNKGALAGEFPIGVMKVCRGVQAPYAGLFGTVAWLQVKALVLALNAAAKLNELIGHILKPAEPRFAHQSFNADETIAKVSFALMLAECLGRAFKNRFHVDS